eukprot:COSAG02_NODE_65774_length_257_cov_0.651899_1_plen_42_part_10
MYAGKTFVCGAGKSVFVVRAAHQETAQPTAKWHCMKPNCCGA